MIQYLLENDDKWHIKNIQIKYKIIIIVQYTISFYLAFLVQYHKNDNKNNINYSPSQF